LFNPFQDGGDGPHGSRKGVLIIADPSDIALATLRRRDPALRVLAVGGDGLVYLNDLGRSVIAVYDERGVPQRTMAVPATAGDARLDGMAVNAKYVFAADTKHPVLHIWALDGTYRFSEDLSACTS